MIRVAKNVFIKFPQKIVLAVKYFREYSRYKKKNDHRFKLSISNLYPCLNDKLNNTPFDHHYTYHPAWAARVLAETRPEYHIDISSILSFSTIVSAFVPIKFYDFRPANLGLKNLDSGFANLKNLPFEENSLSSISCMHTIEHIGLGRYGDEIDPQGDIKSINELKRVLKPGGDILFVVPVGVPKIEFNAHRIYSYQQVIEYFSPLSLKEFSLIPDEGGLIVNADPETVEKQRYGCGCFWFKK